MDSRLSDRDNFHLSKYYPGMYHPRMAYTPSGEVAAAVSTTNGISIAQATTSGSTTAEALGENYDYTLIMYCPILSHLTVNDAQSSINGKQPSGLVVMNCTQNAYFTANMFFGTSQDGSSPRGLDTYLAMDTLYGYTSKTDYESFVYAGKLDFEMVIPQANLTGSMYRGQVRLGQICSVSTAVPPVTANISVNSLIT